MATILEQIVEQTASDLVKRRRKVSFHDFESMECFERSRRGFENAIDRKEEISVIAEVKKASPSKGLIRADFDPVRIAKQYREGGASAISVLTDKPAFQGDLKYLESISLEIDIPLLRKDFIIDPYQVKEARAYGADAILLIATITEGAQLSELMTAAEEFELDALVEIYSEQDLQKIDLEKTNILGANNRNLHTFEVDLHHGVELLQQAGGEIVLVSESGLKSPMDLKFLWDHAISSALIGEYFMRQTDPGKAVADMLEGFHSLLEQEREEQIEP